ncbi:MAG: TIGR02099 family protein [Gammaproteobacteria bacterium]|nr:TIGR02099 family protein [Gammaproteobacteria bacterium]
MEQARTWRRAWRWLLYTAAACAVLMGLTVGALRLALAQVPGYREDIRRWASEATGYDIRFASLTASWPLSGPALTFTGVELQRPGENGTVLAAREFSAGLSLWQLLRDWRPALGRVTMRGVTATVERTADDRILVQGRTLDDLLPRRDPSQRLEIGLALEDIAVTFIDRRRLTVPVSLSLLNLRAAIGRDDFSASARLEPPGDYGRMVEIDIAAPLPLPATLSWPQSLTMRAEGQSLNLTRLLEYAGRGEQAVRSARGNVAFELEVTDGRPARAAGAVDLRDVAVETGIGVTGYQRVAGSAEWRGSGGGWNLSVRDLRLRRQGRNAPLTQAELAYRPPEAATAERWSGSAPFLRLDDLYPLIRAAASALGRDAGMPRTASGDVRDAAAEYSPPTTGSPAYSAQARFTRLGLAAEAGDLAVVGLSGTLVADQDGGRLQIGSDGVELSLGQLFRESLQASELKALLIWRAGPDGIQLLSDDVELRSGAIDIRSRLSLSFPAGGASPVIDLKALASATEAREVLRYLPLRRFPPKVVSWLERAVVAGTVPRAAVEFRGPLREFPFAAGEGTFRVVLDLKDATLDYANGWPRVEALDAEVVFDGVGVSATARTARLARLGLKDYQVRIPDLRTGVLGVSGQQRVDVAEVLDFLRSTPLKASMGASLERASGAGPVDAAIRLAFPIKKASDYDLKVLFDLRSSRLALARLPVDLRNITGRIRVENTRFRGEGLRAVMLGERVRLDVVPLDPASGFGHALQFAGSTPVPRLTATFGLPLREYFGGRVAWRATVQIPARRDRPLPLTVAVRSNLEGLTSSLPVPVAKAADTRWQTTLDLAFPAPDQIDVTGRSELPLSWSLRLGRQKGSWALERGSLQFGAGAASLPQLRGLEVNGRIDRLPFDRWLAVGSPPKPGAPTRRFEDLYRRFDLSVAELLIAGQVFRDIAAVVERSGDAWDATVNGPAADGSIKVPFNTAVRPIELDMRRLWLTEAEAEGKGGTTTDPRKIPALQIKAADAALGRWRLGAVELRLDRDPRGLVASRIEARSEHFSMSGRGAWRVEADEPSVQGTEIDVSLKSDDVRSTLVQLGFDPVMTGKQASVAARLRWSGGPDGDFLARSSGTLAVEFKDGQVVDLEPGGSGRLLGLISITALPRRLSLDFRDVFNEGLAFDAIKGDFRLGAGIAYTCNLGLNGPAADLGLVGRSSLALRDYEQVAVVRPQVSNMLTVGGAVLGGPVGGATMLLISQIFRKPLSTLGESYYRVSGGWDVPEVTRVQRSDVDASAFKDCEKDVEAALRALPPQESAAAEPSPDPGRP